MNEQEYQDFITFEPEPVRVIQDEEQITYMEDSSIEPVIILLRDGHFTMKEIESRYNEMVDKADHKSDMSVYRYVKRLEEYNLVVQSGQRVVIGKTATETLYSRTAKVFYPVIKSEAYWNTREMREIIEILRILIGLYTKKEKPSKECVKAMLTNIEANAVLELNSLLEQDNEEIIELLKSYKFNEINRIFEIFEVMILLFNSEFYPEAFKECNTE